MTQSLAVRKVKRESELDISTKVRIVQYSEPLPEDSSVTDGVDNILGCVQLKWYRTPEVEQNLLPS